ncbi:hypothetical protein QTP88_024241 [Uroleucon formosanum]
MPPAFTTRRMRRLAAAHRRPTSRTPVVTNKKNKIALNGDHFKTSAAAAFPHYLIGRFQMKGQ